jgi:hypothetical protein
MHIAHSVSILYCYHVLKRSVQALYTNSNYAITLCTSLRGILSNTDELSCTSVTHAYVQVCMHTTACSAAIDELYQFELCSHRITINCFAIERCCIPVLQGR